MEKRSITRIIKTMLQDRYLNKLRELPEPIRQFGGLVTITVIVILSFAILNIFWGGGEELIEKMKKEEQRIAEARKLSELISTLPPGILVSYEGTDHQRLSEKQYEEVCNATTIVTQRALMGANLINFQAHKIYTCLLYTSPSPRDGLLSRMPSSA